MCWKIETLRRIFVAMPFLAVSLIGFVTLASLLYEEAYGLDERAAWLRRRHVRTGPARSACSSAPGSPPNCVKRDPALILKFLAGRLGRDVGAVARVRRRPEPRGRHRRQLRDRGVPRDRRPRHPGLALAGDPASRPLDGLLDGLAVDPPGLLMLPFIGWIADHWGIRTGMAMMVPMFLHRRARSSPAVASVDRQRHRAGPPDGARPGRGDEPTPARRGEAPAVPRRRRRVLRRAGAPRRSTSRSTRARSWRCSAPTAPASRPCSRRSPGSSRPTAARSSSTAATSPTPRRTRSPATASSRSPAGTACSPG